uniref:Uncharacterized protein n=1 Tax=Pyxicephalus adspersus TaxID=30357 RepID=A0AAV3AT53_PYXAD|nr:TPA: hypothetical protein GDO54_002111 [Pyxicephalus adspersus]
MQKRKFFGLDTTHRQKKPQTPIGSLVPKSMAKRRKLHMTPLTYRGHHGLRQPSRGKYRPLGIALMQMTPKHIQEIWVKTSNPGSNSSWTRRKRCSKR